MYQKSLQQNGRRLDTVLVSFASVACKTLRISRKIYSEKEQPRSVKLLPDIGKSDEQSEL
jgi:phosphohistidine phosphatase SixA